MVTCDTLKITYLFTLLTVNGNNTKMTRMDKQLLFSRNTINIELHFNYNSDMNQCLT